MNCLKMFFYAYLLTIMIYVVMGKSIDTDLTAMATGYHSSYPAHEMSSKYGDEHDSYGKYLKDYGDQAYNHYGGNQKHHDSGYGEHTLKKLSDYGSHDKYGGEHSRHGSKYGNGLYTRDRGYGYEKHYAYDKELATKAYGAEHGDRGSHYGDHGKHSHTSLIDHGSSGHHTDDVSSKYGQSGHKRNSHASGAYGSHGKKYSAKAYQPYTEYSNEPAYVQEYAPSYDTHSSYSEPHTDTGYSSSHSSAYPPSAYVPAYAGSTPPVYPAYKPAAAYQPSLHAYRPVAGYETYASSHSAPTLHHPGVAYY